MYCAIIGDIVHSKSIPIAERDIVQQQLNRLLMAINTHFSQHISADFIITLGDEFQGLLNNSAYCMDIVEQIIREMHPQKIRFGIGIGDIITQINPQKAIGADGAAYHLAREAITAINKKSNMLNIACSNVEVPCFLVRFETGTVDGVLLNLLSGFIHEIISKWSKKQWEAIKALAESNNSQSDAAILIGCPKSTVSKNLRAAQYKKYQMTIMGIANFLRDAYDTNVTASTRLQQANNLIESAEYFANIKIDFNLALLKHQEAFSIRESIFPNSDERVAESADYIGAIYLKKGDAATAKNYYEKAYAMRKSQTSEKRRENIAKSMQNIGDVLYYTGKYQDAFSWYEKALNIKEKTLGKEHLETAKSYDGVAKSFFALRKYEEALEWHLNSLKIREKTLGKGHPITASSYYNIANIYYFQREYEKSMKWHSEVLKIRKNQLNQFHPDIACSCNSIANIYGVQGNYENAIAWHNKALNIQEEVFGKEHPDTANSYHYIAMTYHEQGDYAKALKWYCKALPVLVKLMGEHPNIIILYNNIANLYYSQREYKNALDALQKALGVQMEVWGNSHPSTASLYCDIADVYDKLKMVKEAKKYREMQRID